MANIELKVGHQISKPGLAKRAQFIIDQVNNGELDALEAFIVAKGYAKLADAIMKGIQDTAKTEAAKYTDRDNTKDGVKFTIVEGGGPIFDYSQDPHVSALEAELKERKDAIKRASMAKINGKNDPVILDGEEIQAMDPTGYRAGYLKIEL